jgi:hypothetical protein
MSSPLRIALARGLIAAGLVASGILSPVSLAKDGEYRCEVKKQDGSLGTDAKIKSRKDCKKAGGKWEKKGDGKAAAAAPEASTEDAAPVETGSGGGW